MALDHSLHRPAKTLGESAICFACTMALMLAAAVGVKWVMGLLF